MPTDIDRIPPQSLDAERSVLGSILLNADMLDEVTPIISADSFYGDAHGRIFSACVELHGKGKRLDAVLIAVHLDKAKQLEEIGGAKYLEEIIETSSQIESLAD